MQAPAGSYHVAAQCPDCGPVAGGNAATVTVGDSLPETAYTGYPGDGYTRAGDSMQPGCASCGPPLPTATFGPWRPPGIGGAWPADEYICDGGGSTKIQIGQDFSVRGLHPEEAIGHFDTLDGRTIVEPTNKVCIYAPRFAAVRKVDRAYNDNKYEMVVGASQPIKAHQEDERNLANTTMQPLQPIGAIEDRGPIGLIDRQPAIVLDRQQLPGTQRGALKAYEDFTFIGTGILQEADKPILAQRIEAAITWTSDQGLQTIIEGQQATAVIGDKRAAAVFEVDVPNHPKLQICKIASTDNAKPGETVDFTIRFDNVGDQKMGNVTIIDNLTPRLEFVPGTAQSSLDATFSTQANEVGSQVLRWEIVKPLAAGAGGVVRFQCKVR